MGAPWVWGNFWFCFRFLLFGLIWGFLGFLCILLGFFFNSCIAKTYIQPLSRQRAGRKQMSENCPSMQSSTEIHSVLIVPAGSNTNQESFLQPRILLWALNPSRVSPGVYTPPRARLMDHTLLCHLVFSKVVISSSSFSLWGQVLESGCLWNLGLGQRQKRREGSGAGSLQCHDADMPCRTPEFSC